MKKYKPALKESQELASTLQIVSIKGYIEMANSSEAKILEFYDKLELCQLTKIMANDCLAKLKRKLNDIQSYKNNTPKRPD